MPSNEGANVPVETDQIAVLIASPLEPELAERIARTSPRIRLLYAPELLPTPRYPADHGGEKPQLSDADSARWSALLAEAEVMFDVDWRAPEELPASAPNLRWVQGTSAGIGSLLQRTGLDTSGIVFTTAAGVHGVPLAEFALAGVLHFVKGVPLLSRRQREHRWERYATATVRGRTAVVVGLGSIGRETIRLLDAVGLKVIGVGRPGSTYSVPGASRLFGLLPAGSIVVNVGRGPVIDESALIDALESGRLAGAALDVFEVEPLPADSPLWDREDVLVSPHSAATLPSENAAIVELFCDNLRRYLAGEPLRNRYRPEAGY
jgi:phosphoglycerate dehydrogenase-like enzyme